MSQRGKQNASLEGIGNIISRATVQKFCVVTPIMDAFGKVVRVEIHHPECGLKLLSAVDNLVRNTRAALPNAVVVALVDREEVTM